MNTRTLLGLVFGVALIAVAGFFVISPIAKNAQDARVAAYGIGHTPGTTSAGSESTAPQTDTTSSSGSASSGTSSTDATYTLADVATHADSNSCWTAINGGVYDVTDWIFQHPGGPQAILSLCGTDGSAAFNGQHGGQRRPEQELASFKIGILAE